MIGIGIGLHKSRAYGSAYANSETSTLLAAMSVQPSAARALLYDNLITSLKSSSVWNLIDALWVMASHDSQAALLNWKNPAANTMTLINSPTFTTDEGFTTNGTTSGINTNWSPFTNGSNWTQSSCGAGLYIRTNSTDDGLDWGGFDAGLTKGSGFGVKFADTRGYFDLNRWTGGASSSTTPISSTDAYWQVNRTGGTNMRYGYDDGTVEWATAALTPTGLTAAKFHLGGYCEVTTFTPATARQYSIFVVGGNFAQSSMWTAFQTYMTAIGKQV